MKRTTKRLSKERRAEIDRILADAAEKAAQREQSMAGCSPQKESVQAPQPRPASIRPPRVGPSGRNRDGIGPQKPQTTWNKIPYGAKKASRRPITPIDAVVTLSVCDHCRKPMWTADKKMESVCEDCEWHLINEKHELRQKMETTAGGRLVNAFADNPQPVINMFGPKSEDLI